jgi:protein-S-isoprenylcysteine O-methyltransferase Ste14
MQTKPETVSPATIVLMLLVVFIIPFLPLLISRQWDWWEAWVNAAIFILGFIVSRALAVKRHPDILVERANYRQHENTAPFDKVLSPVTAFGSAFILVVAGLDELYDMNPEFGLVVEIAALICILAGYVLGTLALLENRFFSGTVRLQPERGHQVVTSGPYAWVRHPGYAGTVLSYLAIPFFLDSPWALVPGVQAVIALVIRTCLEDRFLQANLDGYSAYTQKVRHRLVPGIW